MIAEVIDRTLRRFEDQNCRPAAVKRAGAFFKHTVEQGLRPGFIDAVQELRLRHTLRYVQERSPFYRRLFKEYAITAETIRTVTDLAQLPFTTAADIYLLKAIIMDKQTTDLFRKFCRFFRIECPLKSNLPGTG